MKAATFLVAIFVSVLFLAGCFDSEVTEECRSPECKEANMNQEAPVTDPVLANDPDEQQPANSGLALSNLAVDAPQYDYVKKDDYLDNLPDNHQGAIENGVMMNQLTPQELKKIDVLRTAIDLGLTVGKEQYLESVSMSLQMKDLADDYESDAPSDLDDAGLSEAPVTCPFLKYWDNGFVPNGSTCDYLSDMAKVESYSELTFALASKELPSDVKESEHFDEATFWYEQGAISGIEEERIRVRNDLKKKQFCDQKPTPQQSSHDKGVLLGRQLFAAKFNNWLSVNGYKADYPTMSQPIQVCNVDLAMLEPARSAAVNSLASTLADNPLCADYEAPTLEGLQAYGQAEIEYANALKKGVDDEFAVAAVKTFAVTPCNVSDPIVLDLDGDGIEMLPIHQGVNFNLYGTGQQAVAWVSPDDGFLVIDHNGNGMVDSGLEMFGNVDMQHADGFEHMMDLDANGDMRLDDTDPAFRKLMVWRDLNVDGVSQSNELVPLSRFGIDMLDLQTLDIVHFSGGTRIPKVSVATGPGLSLMVGDAFLASAPHPRLR